MATPTTYGDKEEEEEEEEEEAANCQSSSSRQQQQRPMLPICCHPDFDLTTNDGGSSSLKLFRITRAKGKALQSQGFGVTMVVNENDVQGSMDDTQQGKDQEEEHIATRSTKKEEDGTIKNTTKDESNNNQSQKRKEPSSSTTTSTNNNNKKQKTKHQPEPSQQKTSHNFLFLEEVLFLHEQGMLECHSTRNSSSSSSSSREDAVEEPPLLTLTSSQLYGLLDPCGLEMASYLVYAHLRQQTFRVMRYTRQRLALLEECSKTAAPTVVMTTAAAEQEPNNATTTTTTTQHPPVTPPWTHKGRRALLLQLRHDVQHAPPPALMMGTANSSSSSGGVDAPPTFAFCVYPPDANFSKTNPGRPAFLVAITHYSHSNNDDDDDHASTNATSFEILQQLLQQAHGIPIKLATVADSGSVVMFGITQDGVPQR